MEYEIIVISERVQATSYGKQGRRLLLVLPPDINVNIATQIGFNVASLIKAVGRTISPKKFATWVGHSSSIHHAIADRFTTPDDPESLDHLFIITPLQFLRDGEESLTAFAQRIAKGIMDAFKRVQSTVVAGDPSKYINK